MKKMIVAGLLALTLAVAPGVAFGAATTPLLPMADAPACAGCATGFHRIACPTTVAQSLFATIDHCANRVHGCLGMSGTCPTDGTACQRHGEACPNGSCPADGTACPRHGDACPYASTESQSSRDNPADNASDGWTCPRSGHHGNGHGCSNGAGHGCRR